MINVYNCTMHTHMVLYLNLIMDMNMNIVPHGNLNCGQLRGIWLCFVLNFFLANGFVISTKPL